jgi:hypothetical protein
MPRHIFAPTFHHHYLYPDDDTPRKFNFRRFIMIDKADESIKTAAPLSNDHLLSDFMSQHTQSGGRSAKDIQDCSDAQTTDRATIAALSGKLDIPKLSALLKTDIKQDQDAAGTKRHPGSDQENAALDDKISGLDRKLLKSDPNLTDAQRKALGDDIATHDLDAKYSRGDVPFEQSYIKHDQALVTALATGNGIETAEAAVKADRQHDIVMEDVYIKNNKAMNASNQTVLELFGQRK